MDKHLISLERAQEELHQAFNTCMEDVEEDMVVVKTDLNVVWIWMSSLEKDISLLQDDVKILESSMDNSHLCLEKVEDRVDGFVNALQQSSQSTQTSCHVLGMEVLKIHDEGRTLHKNHSADNTVCAHAKGLILRGRTLRPPSHPRRGKRKVEGAW